MYLLMIKLDNGLGVPYRSLAHAQEIIGLYTTLDEVNKAHELALESWRFCLDGDAWLHIARIEADKPPIRPSWREW